MAIITFPQQEPIYSPIAMSGVKERTATTSWETVISIDGKGYLANFQFRGAGSSTGPVGETEIYIDDVLVYKAKSSSGFFNSSNQGIMQHSDTKPTGGETVYASGPLLVTPNNTMFINNFPNLSAGNELSAINGYLYFQNKLRIQLSHTGTDSLSGTWAFSGGVA